MSVDQQIPNEKKRVFRSIGYALWLESADKWFGLPVIFRARLTEEQWAKLAFMAFKFLEYDVAVRAADAALGFPYEQEEAA